MRLNVLKSENKIKKTQKWEQSFLNKVCRKE